MLPEPQSAPPISEAQAEKITSMVMRRQGALSLRVAAVFIVLLLGLPLVNLFAPQLVSATILGFPATWLFLGVLFYPITVFLSVYFVRHSDRLEAETTLIAGQAKE